MCGAHVQGGLSTLPGCRHALFAVVRPLGGRGSLGVVRRCNVDVLCARRLKTRGGQAWVKNVGPQLDDGLHVRKDLFGKVFALQRPL